MFKLFYKNRKKGFTVVELIVAITLTAIVLGAFGIAFNVIHNTYNSSMLRARITNAVQLATQKFETNTNLIANAKEVDVFYDTVVAEGIIYDESNGTFTWKSGDAKSFVMPMEGSANQEKYSYIFSTPAYDSKGNYLGYFLFARNIFDSNSAGETYVEANANSMLFLDNEGAGDIPVQLELSIASDYVPPPSEDFGTTVEVEAGQKYTDNCIKIAFKSGKEDVSSFSTETKYALENFNGKKVNMRNGKLSMENSWIEANIAKAYPSGWNNEFIGTDKTRGFPSNLKTDAVEIDADGEVVSSQEITLTTEQIQKPGNVLRFLSPLSDNSVEDTIGQGSQLDKGSCPLEDYFWKMDTSVSEPILTELRSFRDNVLKGNAVGDAIINFYYNDFKPFYFDNKNVMRPIVKIIMDPLVYIYCALKE